MENKIDYLFEDDDLLVNAVNIATLLNLGFSRQFVLKDFGLTPRVFDHWASKGLVDTRIKQNNHNHIFTLVELVWFSIVTELRGYGFSLEKIKLVHDQLMADFDMREYLNEMPEKNFKRLMEELDSLPTEEKEVKDEIIKMMGAKLNVSDIAPNEFKTYALFIYIFCFIMYRSNVWIYINSDGKVFPYIEALMKQEELSNQMEEISFDRDSYISISLMKYFKILVQDKKHLNFVSTVGILNENEQHILSLIREGKAKAITIRFEAQKPSMIEVTQERKLIAEARVSEILLGKGYQDIQIKTQGGDIVFTNVTTKKKL